MKSSFLVLFLVGCLHAFSSDGNSVGSNEEDVMEKTTDQIELESSPDSMTYVDAETSDPCSQPKQMGVCRAYFRKFYYNKQSKSCEEFDYGGCGGNANNFATKEECNKACTKAKPTERATTLPTGEEECMDMIPDCADNELLCRHIMFGEVMRRVCKKTCGFCSCKGSDHGMCIGLQGYCSKGHYWVERNCKAICGKCTQKEGHIWDSAVL